MGETSYWIADNRIEVNSSTRTVVADGELLDAVGPHQFDVWAVLASRPDTVMPWSTFSREALGYEDDSFARAALRQQLKRMRGQVAEDLGDTRKGAIRTQEGIGCYTVSSLSGEISIIYQNEDPEQQLKVGSLAVHLDKHLVTKNNVIVEATPTQYEIAKILTQCAERPTDISEICMRIWEIDTSATRANARQQIMRLRHSLGDDKPDRGTQGTIKTDPKGGYYIDDTLAA